MQNFIKRFITTCALLAVFLSTFILLPPIYFSLLLAGILVLMLVTEWPHFFSIKRPLFWLIMPWYPILPFALLIWLNESAEYRVLLFVLCLMVSFFDLGSYIAGKLCGRHHIAPAISPGKTWEGVIGGYFVACAVIQFVGIFIGMHMPVSIFYPFVALVCACALVGDLFESYIKRRAGMKDSGFLLPGHGGFFDRFDGIMAAAPLFFFLRDYLIYYFGSCTLA